MNKGGPIIIIEDDQDDRELIKNAFEKLKYPNKLFFFQNGEEALKYLNKPHEPTFLIMSDINMPKLTGFELRKKLKEDSELEIKCIPYLFFSTSNTQNEVIEAYKLSVQGFFVKPQNHHELEKTLSVIMEYWKRCSAPNNF